MRRNLDARLARVARAKIAAMSPSDLTELRERLRFGARVSIHAALREQLARLQQEHRDLDAAISALQTTPGSDLLQVQRLKKRKLFLRDRIKFIEDQLTPDIIA